MASGGRYLFCKTACGFSLRTSRKNAPLVSGIIASGKDADWMEPALVTQAFTMLDLTHQNRLSEAPREEDASQWAAHEGTTLKQSCGYFLRCAPKSGWSDFTVMKTLKAEWLKAAH